jgi:hypothetical protein
MQALTASQNAVITAVNKQKTRADDVKNRVTELENAVGSTSDLNLKAAADDGTTVDMPTLS